MMKYAPLILIAILILLVAFSFGPIQTYSEVSDDDWIVTESDKVLRDLEKLSSAYLEMKPDPIIELAHANVLLSEGGPETLRTQLNETFDNFRQSDVSFTKFKILDTPEFFQSKYDDFVIVRTEVLFANDQASSRLVGFVVGHKKRKEENWKYLDASGGSSEAEGVVRYHLPELPIRLSLPESFTEPLPSDGT